MIGWWKAQRHGGACGEGAHEFAGGGRWGRHWGGEHDGAHAGPEHDGDFGSFGVRRPLRFLAHKLELEENQITELARILNELKTERAQAAVDYRRSTAAIADAISGEALDDKKLTDAAADRVKSAEHLRDAVTSAIRRIHAVLDNEQRAKLAYLIRTGALSI
jgi:hypothetical protein